MMPNVMASCLRSYQGAADLGRCHFRVVDGNDHGQASDPHTAVDTRHVSPVRIHFPSLQVHESREGRGLAYVTKRPAG